MLARMIDRSNAEKMSLRYAWSGSWMSCLLLLQLLLRIFNTIKSDVALGIVRAGILSHESSGVHSNHNVINAFLVHSRELLQINQV